MRRALVAALAAALALAVFGSVAGQALLPALGPLIAWRFPDVAWVSAEVLDREPRPVLLDVRSGAEFAVSRIAGARRLDPEAPDRQLLASLPKDAAIVVYCSVGVRSAQAARRLRQAGFSRVLNLEGGIFGWANAGRPLQNDAGAVLVAHPYAWPWSLLLARGRRASFA